MEDTSIFSPEVIIALVVSGIIGAAIAQHKHASLWLGFCWGFLLGPIGWIVGALVLKPADQAGSSVVSQVTAAATDPEARAKRVLAAKLAQVRKDERSAK